MEHRVREVSGARMRGQGSRSMGKRLYRPITLYGTPTAALQTEIRQLDCSAEAADTEVFVGGIHHSAHYCVTLACCSRSTWSSQRIPDQSAHAIGSARSKPCSKSSTFDAVIECISVSIDYLWLFSPEGGLTRQHHFNDLGFPLGWSCAALHPMEQGN